MIYQKCYGEYVLMNLEKVRMIFFPSWLPHGVDINMNTEKGEKNWRISVSYNFIQV